jgi:hypothetical protein
MQCSESILAALDEGWQMEISLFDALCQPDSYHQLSGASPAKKIAFLRPILQFALGSVHEFRGVLFERELIYAWDGERTSPSK